MPGEEEYVSAWMGPAEPVRRVRGVEGKEDGEDEEAITALRV